MKPWQCTMSGLVFRINVAILMAAVQSEKGFIVPGKEKEITRTPASFSSFLLLMSKLHSAITSIPCPDNPLTRDKKCVFIPPSASRIISITLIGSSPSGPVCFSDPADNL